METEIIVVMWEGWKAVFLVENPCVRNVFQIPLFLFSFLIRTTSILSPVLTAIKCHILWSSIFSLHKENGVLNSKTNTGLSLSRFDKEFKVATAYKKDLTRWLAMVVRRKEARLGKHSSAQRQYAYFEI